MIDLCGSSEGSCNAFIVGVVTRAEVALLDEVNTPHGKWWVPFVWCGNLLKDARRHGRIQDNYLLKTLVDVSAPPLSILIVPTVCRLFRQQLYSYRA